MTTSWVEQRLGDVCQLISGQHIPADEYNSEGLGVGYLTGPSDFGPRSPRISKWTEHPKVFARSGDILITVKGSGVGSINLLDQDDIAISRQLMAIRVTSVDPRFVHAYIGSKFQDFQTMSTGAAIPGIAREQILDLRIGIPPLPEQRRIVSILDEAFEGIATAKANAEKNLQNARELFERFMQTQFSLRGSEGAERTLEDVCEISSKLVDPRCSEYLDLPHIGAGNIESRSGTLVDIKTAREEHLISGKFLFDESSVLYSKIRPYLMKVVRPTFSGLCSADIYPLVPKPDGIARDYLYYLLLTPSFTDYAIQGSARAGMPKVNRDHLFAYRLWLPSIQEQTLVAGRLDTLRDRVGELASTYTAKLSALSELKKSLLHQAFTGTLTAKSVDKQVAEFA